jgi:hypothetical protein
MTMDTRDRQDLKKGNPAADDRQDEAASIERAREISGPGAADFLTAPGGIDTPETDPAKGTRGAHDAGRLTDASRLVPRLDQPRAETERAIEAPEGDETPRDHR